MSGHTLRFDSKSCLVSNLFEKFFDSLDSFLMVNSTQPKNWKTNNYFLSLNVARKPYQNNGPKLLKFTPNMPIHILHTYYIRKKIYIFKGILQILGY